MTYSLLSLSRSVSAANSVGKWHQGSPRLTLAETYHFGFTDGKPMCLQSASTVTRPFCRPVFLQSIDVTFVIHRVVFSSSRTLLIRYVIVLRHFCVGIMMSQHRWLSEEVSRRQQYVLYYIVLCVEFQSIHSRAYKSAYYTILR